MNNKVKNVGTIKRQMTPQTKKKTLNNKFKPDAKKDSKNYEIKVWSYDYDMID